VPGSVVSRDDAKIASAEAGRLDYVAEVGTRVKAGERIAKLDDQTLRLRREEIQSDVRRAEAQRSLSDTQLQRLAKLENLQQHRQDADGRRRAPTLETNAQMLAHGACRNCTRSTTTSTRPMCTRPFAGIVTERFAQRGEYLQVGASIVHLVDTGNIEARVQAPLAMADKIRAGMQVRVKSAGQEKSANVRGGGFLSATNTRRQFELAREP